MFRTVPLSIIRSFSLYTQQTSMTYTIDVCTVKTSYMTYTIAVFTAKNS